MYICLWRHSKSIRLQSTLLGHLLFILQYQLPLLSSRKMTIETPAVTCSSSLLVSEDELSLGTSFQEWEKILRGSLARSTYFIQFSDQSLQADSHWKDLNQHRTHQEQVLSTKVTYLPQSNKGQRIRSKGDGGWGRRRKEQEGRDVCPGKTEESDVPCKEIAV